MDGKYEALLTATQDLLCELRITRSDLDLMARGFSPDYPGASSPMKISTCKVQISGVVAQKLVNVMALED